MKKVFAVFFLAVALVLVGGQSSKVEAAEVYIGNYSDGTAVYLLTHTVKRYSEPLDYSCTVRAGRDYLDYLFFWEGNVLYYKNSEGYHGQVYDGSSPVAQAIHKYIRGR